MIMGEKEILNLEEINKIGRAAEIDAVKDNKIVREIVTGLKRTMKAKNLTSLSAPGIGYAKRIFCIDYSDSEVKTYINPVITNATGLELSREICSSIPGKEYIRPRNSEIDIIYQTPSGQITTRKLKGLAAIVFQHEIDHLEGITLDDIGLEIDKDFDEASEEDRAEVINMYLESLDMKREDLKKEIDADETLHSISESYRFVEALARGDISLETIDEE